MRTIITILVLFLIQCTYLRAELNQVPLLNKFSDSCIFGVKSVSLFLYNSRSNITGEEVLENELCNNIDPSQPVVFLVHGFTSYANSSHIRDLAMQLKHKYTVFALDWSQGACTEGLPILKFTAYPSAVINTREIGHLLANHTVTLIKQCGVPLENIIYIGHSLGAHVCGFAGKNIQKIGLQIKLIIGADPAMPLFKINKCEEKLCKSDATFVTILHTSDLGLSDQMGNLDLYFNGGHIQPKCGINFMPCSHSRAITYMADIFKNKCGFPGVPNSSSSYPDSNTTDCIVMNSNILDYNNSMEGKYYVFVDKDSHCTQETFNCKQ
ncbi:Venom phospholipase A1 [Trachymyrmex septentrionalis]|uniref:phospholipase A1 n=1 Tax=Trachymyrmex septentrionalis TaxID=34720 RepID=A0A195EX25_9HYME|nr:PREDICTED: phospholipase A1-like [Trachymyrmex septentrionalis]KYN32701.1 Venom phospholipase A1 [Trachymyrmex septentrionalis]